MFYVIEYWILMMHEVSGTLNWLRLSRIYFSSLWRWRKLKCLMGWKWNKVSPHPKIMFLRVEFFLIFRSSESNHKIGCFCWFMISRFVRRRGRLKPFVVIIRQDFEGNWLQAVFLANLLSWRWNVFYQPDADSTESNENLVIGWNSIYKLGNQYKA